MLVDAGRSQEALELDSTLLGYLRQDGFRDDAAADDDPNAHGLVSSNGWVFCMNWLLRQFRYSTFRDWWPFHSGSHPLKKRRARSPRQRETPFVCRRHFCCALWILPEISPFAVCVRSCRCLCASFGLLAWSCNNMRWTWVCPSPSAWYRCVAVNPLLPSVAVLARTRCDAYATEKIQQ